VTKKENAGMDMLYLHLQNSVMSVAPKLLIDKYEKPVNNAIEPTGNSLCGFSHRLVAPAAHYCRYAENKICCPI
jgi:hypothetical protein